MTAQPDWMEIISLCGQKMEAKHKKFGDSWTTCTLMDLLERIRIEHDELRTAVLLEGVRAAKWECIDLISQTAMLYSRMGRLTEDKK